MIDKVINTHYANIIMDRIPSIIWFEQSKNEANVHISMTLSERP